MPLILCGLEPVALVPRGISVRSITTSCTRIGMDLTNEIERPREAPHTRHFIHPGPLQSVVRRSVSEAASTLTERLPCSLRGAAVQHASARSCSTSIMLLQRRRRHCALRRLQATLNEGLAGAPRARIDAALGLTHPRT